MFWHLFPPPVSNMNMIIVRQNTDRIGKWLCVSVCVLASSPFPPLSPFFVPKTGFEAETRERERGNDDATPIPPPSTVPTSFLISTVCVILISPDLAYSAKLSSPLLFSTRGGRDGPRPQKRVQSRSTFGEKEAVERLRGST